MSRIRSIKPEFWSNEQVMNCSTNARLLFIGLWNFVDDSGRHSLAYKQLKALVFPGDDFSSDFIRGLFDELSSNGLLVTYSVDGKDYFQITGWHHQKIDRPQPSKLPPPPVALVEQSPNDRAGGEGKGREGSGVEGKKEPSNSHASFPREAGLSLKDLESRLREAAGWQNEPHPGLCVTGPIGAVIDAGASLDLDVLPVVRSLASKVNGRTGWKYFVGPIRDAMTARVKAGAPIPASADAEARRQESLRILAEQNAKVANARTH